MFTAKSSDLKAGQSYLTTFFSQILLEILYLIFILIFGFGVLG
jgi:hypothetical protein